MPIGIGWLLGAVPAVALAGLASVVMGGGRHMMQPIRALWRNSRWVFALAAPCGMGRKEVAFWYESEDSSLREWRKVSSVGSAGRKIRRFERHMLRLGFEAMVSGCGWLAERCRRDVSYA